MRCSVAVSDINHEILDDIHAKTKDMEKSLGITGAQHKIWT
jgi:hypothetical protein